MSRITTCFTSLGSKKALIPYVTAGDPSNEILVSLLHRMVAGGADIIEVGIPFSDPMAEGIVIQEAHERALENGMTMSLLLEGIKQFRQDNQNTPIILMGYLNTIEAIGYENFAKQAYEAGVDGVIIVDLPPEECSEIHQVLESHQIDLIFLISPTCSDTRIEQICSKASGYIYYIALKGITGADSFDMTSVAEKLPDIRKLTDLPITVGFGVKNETTAQAVSQVADGVVIGSAIIKALQEESTQNSQLKSVEGFLSHLRQAIDQ